MKIGIGVQNRVDETEFCIPQRIHGVEKKKHPEWRVYHPSGNIDTKTVRGSIAIFRRSEINDESDVQQRQRVTAVGSDLGVKGD